MKAKTLLAVALLASALAARSAITQEPDPGPVPANAFITFGGFDWVWASPCDGGCSQIIFQDGFGYATVAQWANRPQASDFLDPGGNFSGVGGQMRCGSPWFDLTWDHCDYEDGVNGLVTSGPLNGQSFDSKETWLVRGEASTVPEPGSLLLVGTGLFGIVGTVRRRFFQG